MKNTDDEREKVLRARAESAERTCEHLDAMLTVERARADRLMRRAQELENECARLEAALIRTRVGRREAEAHRTVLGGKAPTSLEIGRILAAAHTAGEAVWRDGETPAECWARHIHEAEERGARWALAATTACACPTCVGRNREAATRICAEARKADSDE